METLPTNRAEDKLLQGINSAVESHLYEVIADLGPLGCKSQAGMFNMYTMNRMVERLICLRTLEYCRWSQVKAAPLIGVDRNTLRKILKRHGLSETAQQMRNAWN